MKTVSVSSLVAQVSAFLKKSVNLNGLLISGELSNVKYVNGHCYFDLKDDKGQISCTLWKSYAARLGFRMEDGMAVLVHGSLNVYEKRGTLQLSADSVTPAGEGALYLELERRKKLLEAQGFFSPAHKLPRPAEIQRIGIVTGQSTAALQDVMKTIKTRWPMLEVHLFPASVQGEQAPGQIVKALEQADQAGLDAVLLVRGGGSFEDLFCFNDEQIVKTLYNMKTYTVTGIGHEIDTSLADLAADHRALTPTAAAQWVTPDQNEIRLHLQSMKTAQIQAVRRLFENQASRLMMLQNHPYLSSPHSFVASRKSELARLESMLVHGSISLKTANASMLKEAAAQLDTAMEQYERAQKQRLERFHTDLLLKSPQTGILQASNTVERLTESMEHSVKSLFVQTQCALDAQEKMLKALSWQNTLARGFSIIQKDDQIIKNSASLCAGDDVSIVLYEGSAKASILSTQPPVVNSLKSDER